MTIKKDIQQCIQLLVERVGKRLVVGLPLGLGKANHLINALYEYIAERDDHSLEIITALSLEVPSPASDFEQRLAGPIIERLYAGYPHLKFVQARRESVLPDNISVSEFFLTPGRYLFHPSAQQDYISSNYTHVARDMLDRGVNVIMQMVSPNESLTRFSLSSNPDVTLDLAPAMRQKNRPCMVLGEINRQLPYLYGDAEVDQDYFDLLYDAGSYTLFSTPKTTVTDVDHLIGLYASALVPDEGTLQLGIGSLGDAATYALILRQKNNTQYCALLEALQLGNKFASIEKHLGGIEAFDKGLYGATEMFTDGFLHLMHAEILKRQVYDNIVEQEKANAGENLDSSQGTVLHGGFYLGPADFYQALRETGRIR